CARRNENADVW
nr:immunoglobulin heavy chain junction region [Macaca mulatta]MOX91501.1 immunoglobulin heavy chain junction region [Macaca mulatta]MOX92163.1 immunoglobulin heavy chain junction region [Macaca mulatta]MOX92811.1 immunoglobulin heavy chain junction region [Macaca mulatta]MOX93738.1 immunoglobulin heavy chain junction region [Macaca mulatta]